MTKYVVAPGRTVWNRKLDAFFTQGHEIDLSHLNAAEIDAVIKSGAVIEIAELPTPKEVKNGKTDSQ